MIAKKTGGERLTSCELYSGELFAGAGIFGDGPRAG